MEYLELLKERNTILFWFGSLNLVTTIVLTILSFTHPLEFGGTNAWYKPIKFALSTTILAWTIAWYCGYLNSSTGLNTANWIICLTLAFEVIYIAIQARKGEASHFNLSTPFYTFMYSMMAIAATAATLAVGYIGFLFFAEKGIDLPEHYLWAIRLGFILFVIFSFQGFVMGSRLEHNIGGPDGGAGLPFLNWSINYGDLRIAHFVGMHALQILPIIAWFLLKDVNQTFLIASIYTSLAIFVFVQALRGHALINL